MSNTLLHLFIVCSGFYMGGIHKNFIRVYQLKFVAFRKDMREYLFKQVGVFKASRIVLSKG